MENLTIPEQILTLKGKISKVNWNDRDSYKKGLEYIVSVARSITKAEVGVLFLTSDDIFLEAAQWSEKDEGDVPSSPPASELPTYRLNWWEEDAELLDGITAYVAIRKEAVNLNQNEVFAHRAWKGKWDAVFLGGERTRCKGILAVPIVSEKNKRVHGVLKVENPGNPTPYCRFTSEQEENLKILSTKLAEILDDSQNFWRNFVEVRADLKVSYIVELLERGRPTSYNLSQSLNYVNSLFKKWLGCDDVVHVFWRSGKPPKCHILSSWDKTRGLELTQHTSLDSFKKEHFETEDQHKTLTDELVEWLEVNVGPKIVQPGLKIDNTLWKVLFPELQASKENSVDVIRLKAGKFDIGAILLPQSDLIKEGDKETEEENRKRRETLTRLAMNVVSILGRFIEDEYETTKDTYLPLHRPPKVQKTCAILFADIRNFSSLVQILRLMGKTRQLEPFMDQFCSRMGKVISETPLGRVDKFLGDGVMAFFGEYLDDSEIDSNIDRINDQNIKKIVAAVDCARKMLNEFRVLHKEWIEKGLSYTDRPRRPWCIESLDTKSEREPLIDYGKQFNEDIQIDLAIGINIGEIYFDYFGDRIHREYTAIGDHVNFAQRITGVAGEYDESIRRMRLNILLSQTAYQLLRESGCLLCEKEPFRPHFKGFGFAYPIYELECKDLNYAKIVDIMNEMNRNKYEKQDGKKDTCLQCTLRDNNGAKDDVDSTLLNKSLST